MATKKKKKRFCLERFVHYDEGQKMETWELTEWCDDRTDVLETMFLAPGMRIYDTHAKKEIRRNHPYYY